MGRLSNSRWLVVAGALLATLGAVRPVHAQDADDQKRAVARISLMEGDVSVRRGDSGDWVAGVINAPLMADDHIATGPNSRAEVQLDAANVVRMGGNAEVRLTAMEDGRYQMELAHGTLTYNVIRPSGANAEVDTPNVSVRPSKQGVYRISVNDNGDTQVTARAGEVEVFTPRGSQWVTAGQSMMARGTAADPEFQIVAAIPLDDWDRWNQERDRVLTQSRSYQYVPQGVYGAEDLDSAGTWVDVPTYGHVWRPTVAAGVDWAPYRHGRWVWEDWYGWTWVSADPWGWAPYHYGRWFDDPGFGWCWYPGAIGVRHYWSPALVAFFGYGGGAGFGFGFGNVGWVPLAPFEVFHPWWGRGYYGRGFGRNINITNVNITNVYRNASVGGVSGMSAEHFQSGRFGNIGRVNGAQVQTAGLVRGQMPMTPGSSHLRFSDRNVGNVPRTTSNRQFFTHQQPGSVQRVPFAQQQRGFAAAGGSNVGMGRQAEGGIRGQQGLASNPAARGSQAVPNESGPRGGGNGGWRSFGGGNNAPAGNPSASPQQGMRNGGVGASRPAMENTRPPQATSPSQGSRGGGWSRFGDPGNSPRQPQAAPRSNYQDNGSSAAGAGRRFGDGGGGGGQQPIHVSPSVTRERPSYSAPRQFNESPRYSAPPSNGGGGGGAARQFGSPAPRSNSAPSYSAPRGGGGGAPRGGGSAPSYSAPRGGGGGGSAPRSSGGGGGGGHASSGGGHGRH